MAAITPVSTATAGAAFSPAAASGGGDTFANAARTALLYVNNAGGAPITVTITAQNTSRPGEGQWPDMTLGDLEVTVANGAAKILGPFPAAYNDASGNVSVGYSAVTSVTVAVIQP